MKKWSEIKKTINSLDPWDENPGLTAVALQELFEWLDNWFYGEWRQQSDEKLKELIEKRKRNKEIMKSIDKPSKAAIEFIEERIASLKAEQAMIEEMKQKAKEKEG